MKISKTIIFFGTDSFSLASLKSLVESGYTITAVVTKPDSKSGRGHQLQESVVKKFAKANNISVWQPIKVTDIVHDIEQLGSDTIGILSSYGKIIPKSIIDLFSPGIINIHPSLLPIYRGPSPIEAAIKNGDQKTGVSIMQLSAGMDSGPVYKQVEYPLSGNETGPELSVTLAELGASTLLSVLPSILNNSLSPIAQDDSKVIYCRLLSKDDSWIKFDEVSSEEAERSVRAYLDYPKSKVNVGNYQLTVLKAHTSDNKISDLDIKCKTGYLSIDQIIAPSGRKMSSQDFINGYLK